MRLGITKPRSGKKAPASETQHLPLPQLSRLRARLAILNGTGDRRFWLSARALVFENSPRHAPCSLTASDGLTLPSRGVHFRARSLAHHGGDNSSERRSLAANAWFRVAACDLRLGERPDGLLTPLGPWVQLG